MIKYKVQSIAFILFISVKPINHSLKVFVVACASTAIIIVFKRNSASYLSTRENSSVAVCDRLINTVGLKSARV